jgi:hypothetical protein
MDAIFDSNDNERPDARHRHHECSKERRAKSRAERVKTRDKRRSDPRSWKVDQNSRFVGLKKIASGIGV